MAINDCVNASKTLLRTADIGDWVLFAMACCWTLAFNFLWIDAGEPLWFTLLASLLFLTIAAFACLTNGFGLALLLDLFQIRRRWLTKKLLGHSAEWRTHTRHPLIGEISLNPIDWFSDNSAPLMSLLLSISL